MILGTLFIVSAPSGAGKTSLVKGLVNSVPDITASVSYTTRPRRSAEIEGWDYHFIDPETFEEMVQAGAFLEDARVFDHRYGTAEAAVDEELAQGRDMILEIDWQGAQQVRERRQESRSVFILPPSREVLEQRLRGRGQDSEAVIQRRLEEAVAEVAHHADYDYLIVNDDFDRALASLAAIVQSHRQRRPAQAEKHRNLIAQFLRE